MRIHLANTTSSDAISAIPLLEVQSALNRRYRAAEISENALSRAMQELKHVDEDTEIVKIDAPVLVVAGLLLVRHILRSLDALQLASALAVRDRLGSEELLVFIASDNRLLSAATAESFVIWNPEVQTAPAFEAFPVN